MHPPLLLLVGGLLALSSLSTGAPTSGSLHGLNTRIPRVRHSKEYISAYSRSTSSSDSQSPYKLISSYTSTNFFNEFTFFSSPDPTSGHVQYQTRAGASQKSLAGRIPSVQHKPVFLGVDHTSQAPDGRASVRVQSKDSWMHGLFVFDIAHMPTGCGTWPAAWLVGTDKPWPQSGEIDILEGVNDQIGNRMTLHTNQGCAVANSSATNPHTNSTSLLSRSTNSDTSQSFFSGNLTTSNCDVQAPNQPTNAGCQIADSNPHSYGESLNKAGGGVFAVEWDSAGITIWFFSRGGDKNTGNNGQDTKIPNDLADVLQSTSSQSSNSSSSSTIQAPDPSSWPMPVARFISDTSGSGCDFDTHFQNQSIVINTSLCGDWAGAVWNSSPTCAAKADSCVDFVSRNPAAFVDAWWAINEVQIWQR